MESQYRYRSGANSRELKLAMADSVILAARARNAAVWTQDEHFNGLEGVRYVEKR